MTQSPFGPYHLGEQRADGLLAPVEESLEELATRLTHFVRRIPMPAADREVVSNVEAIVRAAHERVGREIRDAR